MMGHRRVRKAVMIRPLGGTRNRVNYFLLIFEKMERDGGSARQAKQC